MIWRLVSGVFLMGVRTQQYILIAKLQRVKCAVGGAIMMIIRERRKLL